TSDDERECDVPVKDDSSLVFKTFSNPLFDYNNDFTSSYDESLSDEEIPIEDFKVYSNPLFDDEIDLHFPRPLENFQSNTIIETLPTSPIPLEDSDSQRKEIDIFIGTDELLPPSIESDDYDSEGEIHVLEELLVNDSIFILENESFYFDHHDKPSYPRPPPKPPD
nr:hypothetical protein [Tanacetum cinerariifolium]